MIFSSRSFRTHAIIAGLFIQCLATTSLTAQKRTFHEVRLGGRVLVEEYELSSLLYLGWHPTGAAKVSARPFANFALGTHDPYDEVLDPNDFVLRENFRVYYWEGGIQTCIQSKYIILRNHTGFSRIWSPEEKMQSFTCFTTRFGIGTGKIFKRVDLSLDLLGIELNLQSDYYWAKTLGFSIGYRFGINGDINSAE